jgi:hypothetical protein
MEFGNEGNAYTHLLVGIFIFAVAPAFLTGCASTSTPTASVGPSPVIVVPADPSRDLMNTPDATSTDSPTRTPTISDPNLQYLQPQ